MTNDFQKWLIMRGYTRSKAGAWLKDGKIVSGKELSNKLDEWNLIRDA